jgi:hypothetical protein
MCVIAVAGVAPCQCLSGKPHHVSGPHLLDRPALLLYPAQNGEDVQHLTHRMGVPGRAGAWLEGDAAGTGTGRLRQRV